MLLASPHSSYKVTPASLRRQLQAQCGAKASACPSGHWLSAKVSRNLAGAREADLAAFWGSGGLSGQRSPRSRHLCRCWLLGGPKSSGAGRKPENERSYGAHDARPALAGRPPAQSEDADHSCLGNHRGGPPTPRPRAGTPPTGLFRASASGVDGKWAGGGGCARRWRRCLAAASRPRAGAGAGAGPGGRAQTGDCSPTVLMKWGHEKGPLKGTSVLSSGTGLDSWALGAEKAPCMALWPRTLIQQKRPWPGQLVTWS
ncbi:actin-related protein 2/3 complex subunit 5-like protein isoform X2 [Octodon degus]|uniref:Actin-related protein 2/3 complex subunit 5-like protein isoform X2 n=1 Tax=Octodon degus TaxID=10160 RepID=A0A6P6DBB3_OCTDE|nr:actin-related protein 2/3 complex subunit 5-like protein isoform X2 [Octodon degus]